MDSGKVEDELDSLEKAILGIITNFTKSNKTVFTSGEIQRIYCMAWEHFIGEDVFKLLLRRMAGKGLLIKR